MLSDSPSLLFGGGSTGPVVHQGRELWLSHWFAAQPGTRLRLHFERFRKHPVQGLRVLCRDRKHKLRINGHEAPAFVLWTNTAPPEVELEVAGGRTAREIGLVNVWELPEYGTTMQGVNAAAMAVTQLSENELRLECSDGYGTDGPNLDDLVVRLVITPPAA